MEDETKLCVRFTKSFFSSPRRYVLTCTAVCAVWKCVLIVSCSHHIGLPGLLDVVCGYDDWHLPCFHNLHQMLPDPGQSLKKQTIMTECHVLFKPFATRKNVATSDENLCMRVRVCMPSGTYLALSTGSTPTVGSSRMSSSGFWSRAAPRDTLRLWPPLRQRKNEMDIKMRRRWCNSCSVTFLIIAQ